MENKSIKVVEEEIYINEVTYFRIEVQIEVGDATIIAGSTVAFCGGCRRP